MKQKHLLIHLMLGLLLLTGCSSGLDSITENTMTVDKDGRLHDVSVEDFSGMDYENEKLEEFVNQKITEYNTQTGTEAIVLEKLEINDDIVKLMLSYNNIEDYNAFNNTAYTLSNLSDAGLSGEFISAADGSKVKAEEIQDDTLKVLKIEDSMNIICKGNIQYYNSYVTKENGYFSSTGDGTAIIIWK